MALQKERYGTVVSYCWHCLGTGEVVSKGYLKGEVCTKYLPCAKMPDLYSLYANIAPLESCLTIKKLNK